MDTSLPKPANDADREALQACLDADIAQGLAELEAGHGVPIGDAFDALWAELGDSDRPPPGESGAIRRRP
ncbi:hypothetical protein [Azospirillum doebereinerae]